MLDIMEVNAMKSVTHVLRDTLVIAMSLILMMFVFVNLDMGLAILMIHLEHVRMIFAHCVTKMALTFVTQMIIVSAKLAILVLTVKPLVHSVIPMVLALVLTQVALAKLDMMLLLIVANVVWDITSES